MSETGPNQVELDSAQEMSQRPESPGFGMEWDLPTDSPADLDRMARALSNDTGLIADLDQKGLSLTVSTEERTIALGNRDETPAIIIELVENGQDRAQVNSPHEATQLLNDLFDNQGETRSEASTNGFRRVFTNEQRRLLADEVIADIHRTNEILTAENLVLPQNPEQQPTTTADAITTIEQILAAAAGEISPEDINQLIQAGAAQLPEVLRALTEGRDALTSAGSIIINIGNNNKNNIMGLQGTDIGPIAAGRSITNEAINGGTVGQQIADQLQPQVQQALATVPIQPATGTAPGAISQIIGAQGQQQQIERITQAPENAGVIQQAVNAALAERDQAMAAQMRELTNAIRDLRAERNPLPPYAERTTNIAMTQADLDALRAEIREEILAELRPDGAQEATELTPERIAEINTRLEEITTARTGLEARRVEIEGQLPGLEQQRNDIAERNNQAELALAGLGSLPQLFGDELIVDPNTDITGAIEELADLPDDYADRNVADLVANLATRIEELEGLDNLEITEEQTKELARLTALQTAMEGYQYDETTTVNELGQYLITRREDIRAEERMIGDQINNLNQEIGSINQQLVQLATEETALQSELEGAQTTQEAPEANELSELTTEQLRERLETLQTEIQEMLANLEERERLESFEELLEGLTLEQIAEALGDDAIEGLTEDGGIPVAILIQYFENISENAGDNTPEEMADRWAALIEYLSEENYSTYSSFTDPASHENNGTETNIRFVIAQRLTILNTRWDELGGEEGLTEREADVVAINAELTNRGETLPGAATDANTLEGIINGAESELDQEAELETSKIKRFFKAAAEIATAIVGGAAIKAVIFGGVGVATGGLGLAVGAVAAAATSALFSGYVHYKIFNKDKPHAVWAERFKSKGPLKKITKGRIEKNIYGLKDRMDTLQELHTSLMSVPINSLDDLSLESLATQGVTQEGILQAYQKIQEMKELTNYMGLDTVEGAPEFTNAAGEVISADVAIQQLGRLVVQIAQQNNLDTADTKATALAAAGGLIKKAHIASSIEAAGRGAITFVAFQGLMQAAEVIADKLQIPSLAGGETVTTTTTPIDKIAVQQDFHTQQMDWLNSQGITVSEADFNRIAGADGVISSTTELNALTDFVDKAGMSLPVGAGGGSFEADLLNTISAEQGPRYVAGALERAGRVEAFVGMQSEISADPSGPLATSIARLAGVNIADGITETELEKLGEVVNGMAGKMHYNNGNYDFLRNSLIAAADGDTTALNRLASGMQYSGGTFWNEMGEKVFSGVSSTGGGADLSGLGDLGDAFKDALNAGGTTNVTTVVTEGIMDRVPALLTHPLTLVVGGVAAVGSAYIYDSPGTPGAGGTGTDDPDATGTGATPGQTGGATSTSSTTTTTTAETTEGGSQTTTQVVAAPSNATTTTTDTTTQTTVTQEQQNGLGIRVRENRGATPQDPDNGRFLAPTPAWNQEQTGDVSNLAFRAPRMARLRANVIRPVGNFVGKYISTTFGQNGDPFRAQIQSGLNASVSSNNTYTMNSRGPQFTDNHNVGLGNLRAFQNRQHTGAELRESIKDIKPALADMIREALTIEYGNVDLETLGLTRNDRKEIEFYMGTNGEKRINGEMVNAFVSLLMVLNDPDNMQEGSILLNEKGVQEWNGTTQAIISREDSSRARISKWASGSAFFGIPFQAGDAMIRSAMEISGFRVTPQMREANQYYTNVEQITRTYGIVNGESALMNALGVIERAKANNTIARSGVRPTPPTPTQVPPVPTQVSPPPTLVPPVPTQVSPPPAQVPPLPPSASPFTVDIEDIDSEDAPV